MHETHMIIVMSSFWRVSVFKMFSQAAFYNVSGLKSVFENLRFRDGFVWTVGLTGEIKLRFQISPT